MDVIVLGLDWGLMTESQVARDAELEKLWVIVGGKLDFAELLRSCLGQQAASFEKTKKALEARLAETEARPDAIITEMAAHRDR